jgi:hypothetical protein
MEEAGSGHGDSSHNILTLDALQVLSRSQVTWSCQCPCGYGRYVKSTCFVYKAIGRSHCVACRAWRYLRMTGICSPLASIALNPGCCEGGG